MVPSSSSTPSSTVSVQDSLDVNDEADWMQRYPGDKDPHSAATSDFEYEDDVEATPGIRPERPRPRWWMRGILPLIAASLSPRESRRSAADARPLLAPASSYSTCKSYSSSRQHYCTFKVLLRCLCFPLLGLLVMLGIVQFISIACGIVVSFFPDEIDRATERWRHGDRGPTMDILHWPTDISRDIVPARCHSHNDYWRPIPLYSALQAGCVSVEADVWLVDNDLYVGHTKSALTPQRTLQNMYINPLWRILEQQNPITDFHPHRDQPPQGVFDTDPSQTLILLIDIKTDGQETWHHVYAQLAPLRERGYLTYFNGTDLIPGPITVVGTGNTPFNMVVANNTHRDIFFDAPLDKLAEDDDSLLNNDQGGDAVTSRSSENVGQGLSGLPDTEIRADTFDWTNSYYASVSFKKSIGMHWSFRLTEREVDKIRAQIRGAHRRGLKVRYWGVPSWPRSLRNHLWSMFVREGVDYLNVDDLLSATRQDWQPRISDWWN
ncbi:hypothetical protein BO94DRAFT_539359 [Aspergillus sclerotioniger CBS 115572]|uniref:Altered inheritance of mitochondria protein 6 n=1 Tax=Aspergillus sclerotioniger CBS 115572 TaxID=1450535 RepID=A0A317VE51_9EURO|nr:hypothetical protein BO94DRAFT_539359 [Aspergillus sclerotioniger CBS 115572]PWY72235.1 hypothetical protein BO94DRAFT_539359 [Aspergillus sclerotioniger CBS 115572]